MRKKRIKGIAIVVCTYSFLLKLSVLVFWVFAFFVLCFCPTMVVNLTPPLPPPPLCPPPPPPLSLCPPLPPPPLPFLALLHLPQG